MLPSPGSAQPGWYCHARTAWTGILRARASPNAHSRALNDPCDASTPTTIRPLCCGLSAEASGSEDNRPVLAIGSLCVRGRRAEKDAPARGECQELARDRRREYGPSGCQTDSSGTIAWLAAMLTLVLALSTSLAVYAH